MNELVKSVLAVSAGLTPDDWPCLIVDRITVAVNRFSVTFHVALLEISRKPVKILIVR